MSVIYHAFTASSLMRCLILLCLLLCSITSSAQSAEPDWVAPMRKVHEGFDGQSGYVAQFGDSITHSLAFWSPLGWDEPQTYLKDDDGLPTKPEGKRWRDVILGTRDKGSEHGNESGWRIDQVLGVSQKVLKRQRPEVAIIMIGTNDISGGRVPTGYLAGVMKLVDECLAAKCIPLLTTIPPRRDHEAAVAAANKILREIAAEKHVPLIDYHAEIMKRRPDKTWLGTLISDDGVHPTGNKTNVYDDENLGRDGYALRNWLTFLKLREVYFYVLRAEK